MNTSTVNEITITYADLEAWEKERVSVIQQINLLKTKQSNLDRKIAGYWVLRERP